ncbi:hypothetical protein K9M79_02715 [Candidatus Woesearchaeota archaeon]|nr:hypothetical protein [Candidatus Woesearchaeota archaeon]
MIQIPLDKIISRIKEEKKLSDEEINDKIKQKLDQLSGLISKEGAAHIIANELGVKLVQTEGKLAIKDVLSGLKNMEIEARVSKVFEIREFNTQRGSGKVGSVMISDGENQMRVVFWGDNTKYVETLKPNDILSIKGGYTKTNNDRIEIHTGNHSTITVNPSGSDLPELEISESGAPSGKAVKISELKGGEEGVEILGTVVQVFDIKFFEVCPECRKRVRDDDGAFKCATHGEVKPNYNYVLTTVVDDGTGSIRSVFFGEQAELLAGQTREQMLEYSSNIGKFDDSKTELLGKIVKIKGRVVNNSMFDRMEIMVNFVDTSPNPEKEIENL